MCAASQLLGGGPLMWMMHLHVNQKHDDYKSKKDSKDQESLQSSTTPVPGYQMGK